VSGFNLDAFVAAAALMTSTRADWHPGSGTGGRTGLALPSALPVLGPSEVEGLLLRDWRANREITQMAGDLVREGVDLEGLPPWVDVDAVQSWLEGDDTDGETAWGDPSTDGLLQALGNWWAEGEAYGGSLLVAVTDDGQPASEPLDRSHLRAVLSWEVLDRWSVWPYRKGGIGSPVDYWVINSQRFVVDRASQIVHPSRVLVHRGRWMPRRWIDNNGGWGASRLEMLIDQRQSLARGHQDIGRLLRRSSQDVITLAEYSEMVAAYGETYTADRLREQARTLETDAVLFLDGGIEKDAAGGAEGRKPDKFESVARPLGGVDAIEAVQHNDWRRGSGMPAVVADGDAAAGLNGGAEAGPWRAWDGVVGAEWKRSILRPLIWGLDIGFASKEGPTGGRTVESYKVCRRPIAEPDYKLEAEIDDIESETDQRDRESGLLSDKEVRQWRNVDGKHGRVRVESAEILPKPPEADEDVEQLDARAEPSACVVVVLPDRLARRFPYKPDDTSPPHCTLLYIGATTWDQITPVREQAAQLAGELALLPCRAVLGPLSYFERDDGSRVAWVGVTFEPALTDYHEQLRARLLAAGVMVQHRDGPWVPHVTLGYLAVGEEYDGPIPVGEWVVERFEVWHGEQ
jgi:2'-5' RNA ligase